MVRQALWLLLALINHVVSLPSSDFSTSLQRRNFKYKLPDGYTIERRLGVGELDQAQVYGAILVAMFGLAYEDSRSLTDPVSSTYPAIILNITGADEDSQYYRQFASYTLYHALETIIATNDSSVANFTLQNQVGAIACKVVLGPPSSEWQQLLGGSSGSGLSPRSPHHLFPALLENRQARSYNQSAPLAKLTPFYLSDWYGLESDPTDFFMALATLIVQVSDISDKDLTINSQSVEESGYHLNVTNVRLPGQMDYLSNRGVLNLCSNAYKMLTRRLGYGIEPVTSFESTLLWTNGTDAIQQHVLRYEGVRRKA